MMGGESDRPGGFDCVREGHLLVVVRTPLRAMLLPLMRAWAAGRSPEGRRLPGGRGGATAIELSSDLRVVLRPYHRGGAVRFVTREWFFGWRPRPLRELHASEVLRARGVRTPEMLAVAVRSAVPGCYRAAVAVREVTQATNLWRYLCSAPAADRLRACRAAATATRAFHDAGAVHPDLNLQNYLVQEGDGNLVVWVLDCDRVRLKVVTPGERRAAFARVCRSIRRLDPLAEVLDLESIEALQAMASGSAGGVPCP